MGRKKAALSGQLADIDLRLLNVYKTVVEQGGFSAAEIPLNLANSTISNYIADLEKRLDMHLCERGRSGFKLTEHGHIVYEATIELLEAINNFRLRINQSHLRLIGSLHLAFAEHTLTVHSPTVVNALQAFTEIAPDVSVQITTMSADDVLTAVQNKKADIGITVMPKASNELDTLALFSEEMLLYCAKGHKLFSQQQISKADLRQYAFVESPRLMQGRECHPDMKNWPIKAKAHHQEARATLLLTGAYLGILPKHLVLNWGLKDKLKALLVEDYGYRNTFKAIKRKKTANELITDTFFNCLHSQVKTINQ